MKNQKGFTLLEILISIVILGIALVPMLQMFSESAWQQKYGSSATTALGLAQDKMEELKDKHIKGIKIESQGITSFPRYGNDYSYTVTVTDETSRLKRVEVVVYYSVDDRPRNITLSTRMGSWK